MKQPVRIAVIAAISCIQDLAWYASHVLRGQMIIKCLMEYGLAQFELISHSQASTRRKKRGANVFCGIPLDPPLKVRWREAIRRSDAVVLGPLPWLSLPDLFVDELRSALSEPVRKDLALVLHPSWAKLGLDGCVRLFDNCLEYISLDTSFLGNLNGFSRDGLDLGTRADGIIRCNYFVAQKASSGQVKWDGLRQTVGFPDGTAGQSKTFPLALAVTLMAVGRTLNGSPDEIVSKSLDLLGFHVK